MSFPPIQNCRFLTGPTGAGKTGIGVELAQKSDAEIISMDSMALYRGMDIGTAKPTAIERAAVPHHLLDVIEPDEQYSVAQYIAAAHEKVEEIRRRGRSVLFVGGTPLYLKGLLRGLFKGPPADPAFRNALEADAAEHGPDWPHARLAQVDPPSAERLHPNDTRRIIRTRSV